MACEPPPAYVARKLAAADVYGLRDELEVRVGELAIHAYARTQLFGVVNKIDGLCALGQIAAAIPSAWRSCSPAAQRW
eukprot:XP_001700234.1 predicted protein [Chlamydomonas reinhardtii]